MRGGSHQQLRERTCDGWAKPSPTAREKSRPRTAGQAKPRVQASQTIKFMARRQVQGQAGKLICRLESGLEIAEQIHCQRLKTQE